MSRLGVDTGGTFTDFVFVDGAGQWRIHKQLSTPVDPAAAILAGCAELPLEAGTPVVHGSTVATNALLERRGAVTALFSTAGFADLLAIGRQNRPELYALVPQKPPPLVPRERRFEIAERVTSRGDVLQAPQLDALAEILEQCAAEGVVSIAICFLFSFLKREHEQAVARAIHAWSESGAARPRFDISLSSEILPEFREYERTSTTVINAYVAPVMRTYLTRLAGGIAPRPLSVMQSNGGLVDAALAGAQAVRTVLSGPAGGVVGARHVAAAAGFDEIITFDMGGTSTDVALCPGALPTTTSGTIAGLPLRLPIIDIHTVGAGGGSLADVDAGGALHVGPASAGADPGPAAYGRAGPDALATTTDANLLLGRLDAAHFLGGEMRLDATAAEHALSSLAGKMDAPTPQAAAWGVLRVANATMERAIRRISVERGFDPRRFTLVAFGGAGPLHACDLAEALGIPRVLIPAVPGVLSALGMVVAAPTRDLSRTVMGVLDSAGDSSTTLRHVVAVLEELSAEARAAADGNDGAVQLTIRLDMRYAGQAHELTIDVGTKADAEDWRRRFAAAHRQAYGYDLPEAAVEVVTARVRAALPSPAPPLPQPKAAGTLANASLGQKAVWFGPDEATPTSLWQRESLPAGASVYGPAVIFQYDTTTVVPPGWRAKVDVAGNLVVAQKGGAR